MATRTDFSNLLDLRVQNSEILDTLNRHEDLLASIAISLREIRKLIFIAARKKEAEEETRNECSKG